MTAEDHGTCIPHVTGVRLADGGEVRADLVVDAGGRRSPLPGWLEAIGARRPVEEEADCGFIYYGRHFRSTDGAFPVLRGSELQPYESVSLIVLAGDHGHWGVGISTRARDRAIRRLSDVDTWQHVMRHYPLVADWVEAEPTTGVDVMAKLEDRIRHFVVDGQPVATGVVAVGDAWACTNPGVGRGASIGLVHATCLRDLLREVPVRDRMGVLCRWDQLTRQRVEPLYRDILAFDAHRLAQIDAQIAGEPYETEDPAWNLGQALAGGARHDPELFRAFLSIVSVLERGPEVFARPGLVERVLAAGPPEPLPGPSRRQLLDLVA